MKDIWEPASYIALRLIVSLRILCNALYGHPFSEYCSYEKKYFFNFILKTCTDGEVLIPTEMLFQALGPLTEMALAPMSVFVLLTKRLFDCRVGLVCVSPTVENVKSQSGTN